MTKSELFDWIKNNIEVRLESDGSCDREGRCTQLKISMIATNPDTGKEETICRDEVTIYHE